jgi:hypothetical protein
MSDNIKASAPSPPDISFTPEGETIARNDIAIVTPEIAITCPAELACEQWLRTADLGILRFLDCIALPFRLSFVTTLGADESARLLRTSRRRGNEPSQGFMKSI